MARPALTRALLAAALLALTVLAAAPAPARAAAGRPAAGQAGLAPSTTGRTTTGQAATHQAATHQAATSQAATSHTAQRRAVTAQARGAPGKLARTVVTFAWGGGYTSQMQSLPIFRQYGLHATYFIPSGLVCVRSPAECARTSPYLTVPQLRRIAAGGNEIGGLSILHTQLNNLPPAEARREVCDDRVNLLRWGFRPSDFAYPFAVMTPAIEAMVRQCGYNAGLGAGELRGAGQCRRCAWAETIPPRNPMEVRAPIEISSAGTQWSLHTYQSLVRGVQRHGGGWIVLLAHQVCARTCVEGVTAAELRSVLAWLHSQAGPDLAVETMQQVIGGPVHRAVPGPRPAPIPAPGVANAALAQLGAGGYPDCFQPSRYGRNTAAFRYDPHGGPHGLAAETLQVTNWASGDAKLMPSLDLGACAPSATPGHRYTVAAQYKATLPTQFDLYYRTAIGSWQYWTSSPAFPASASWAKAHWATPAVPAGATAVSFGLAAGSDGTISTTGYSMVPVTSYRAQVLLGVLIFAVICAGLIARGHFRYKRYVRAQAGSVPPGAGGPGGPGPGQPSAADRASSPAGTSPPGSQSGE